MKIQVAVLGAFLCLGAFAQGQTNNQNTKATQQQTANRMKQPGEAQSVRGCVDEENGHYVLRDTQTDRLIRLQSAGMNADDDFARFVGHQAEASGAVSAGTMTVKSIGKVADMCPVGK